MNVVEQQAPTQRGIDLPQPMRESAKLLPPRRPRRLQGGGAWIPSFPASARGCPHARHGRRRTIEVKKNWTSRPLQLIEVKIRSRQRGELQNRQWRPVKRGQDQRQDLFAGCLRAGIRHDIWLGYVATHVWLRILPTGRSTWRDAREFEASLFAVSNHCWVNMKKVHLTWCP